MRSRRQKDEVISLVLEDPALDEFQWPEDDSTDDDVSEHQSGGSKWLLAKSRIRRLADRFPQAERRREDAKRKLRQEKQHCEDLQRNVQDLEDRLADMEDQEAERQEAARVARESRDRQERAAADVLRDMSGDTSDSVAPGGAPIRSRSGPGRKARPAARRGPAAAAGYAGGTAASAARRRGADRSLMAQQQSGERPRHDRSPPGTGSRTRGAALGTGAGGGLRTAQRGTRAVR